MIQEGFYQKLDRSSLLFLPLSLACLWLLSIVPSHFPGTVPILLWFIFLHASLAFPLFLRGFGQFEIAGSLLLAIIVLYGPLWACILELAVIFLSSLRKHQRHAWDVGDMVMKPVAYGTASLVLILFRDLLFPSLASILVYFIFSWLHGSVEFLFVTYYRSVEKEVPFWPSCRKYFAKMPLVELLSTGVPPGILIAYFIKAGSPFVLLLAIPILLSRKILHYLRDLSQEMEKTIEAMNDVLEAKDEYTERHTNRVAQYAGIIARHYGMPELETEQIVRAARLHDIGKILVQDDILKKPDKLTREEYEQIKIHVQYDMISSVVPQQFPVYQALELGRLHHERVDGTGYPFGLKGEEIPIGARIIAVADAWDAMTSRRVYRANLPHRKALEILHENAGIQWDLKVVEAFFKAYRSGEIHAVSAEFKALQILDSITEPDVHSLFGAAAEYEAWRKKQEWETMR